MLRRLLHRPCLWHFSHLILLLLLLWLKMFLLLPGYIGPAIALKIEHFLSEVSFALFITSHIFNTESKNRKLKVPYIVSVRLRPVSNVVQLPSSYCRVARLGFKRHATAVLKLNLILSIGFSTCYQHLFPKNLNPLWSQEPITGSEQLPHFR